MTTDPRSDRCEQGEAQFKALMLNVCRGRVDGTDQLNSTCTSNDFVSESVALSDALLSSPGRTQSTCTTAQCASEEINSGTALETNSLRVGKESGGYRLTWDEPYTPELGAPKKYEVWRRLNPESAFVKVGETSSKTWLETTSGSNSYQYRIGYIW